MKPSQFLIILVLVSAVITGLYNFYISMASEYGVDTGLSQEYEEKYNLLINISSKTEDAYKNVTGIGAEIAPIEYFTGIRDAFTKTKNIMVAIFTLPTFLLKEFVEDIGLPPWVGIAMGAIITILVIAALLAILIRREW